MTLDGGLVMARYGPDGGVDWIPSSGDGVVASVPASYAAFVLAGRRARTFHVLCGDVSGGEVLTIRADEGGLTVLDARRTFGAEPCHAAIVGDDRLVVANYESGTVSIFDLDETGIPVRGPEIVELSGSGPDPVRQRGPHPHFVLAGFGGHDAIVVDLGSDALWSLDRDADGWHVATFAELEPGAGPRHVVVADGSLIVSGELDGTVTVVDEAGNVVSSVAAISFGADGPAYPGDVARVPGGAAVAIRGRSSVSVLTLHAGTVAVEREVVIPGSWPQQLLSDGRRLLVVDRDGGRILDLDPETGAWTEEITGLRAPMWAVRVEAL